MPCRYLSHCNWTLDYELRLGVSNPGDWMTGAGWGIPADERRKIKQAGVEHWKNYLPFCKIYRPGITTALHYARRDCGNQ